MKKQPPARFMKDVNRNAFNQAKRRVYSKTKNSYDCTRQHSRDLKHFYEDSRAAAHAINVTIDALPEHTLPDRLLPTLERVFECMEQWGSAEAAEELSKQIFTKEGKITWTPEDKLLLRECYRLYATKIDGLITTFDANLAGELLNLKIVVGNDSAAEIHVPRQEELDDG